jgi:hypothetical protein
MEVHLQSAFTAEKTTEPAIDKALEVLNKLHKNGIDENHWLLLKLCQGQFPHDTKLPNNKPAY